MEYDEDYDIPVISHRDRQRQRETPYRRGPPQQRRGPQPQPPRNNNNAKRFPPRKRQNKFGRNDKRPADATTSSSSSSVSNASAAIPAPLGLQVYPRCSYFPIFTSNLGIVHLASVVFDSLSGKDQRMAQMITLPQLQYVLCITWINRVVQCGLHFGYQLNIQGTSDLKRAASQIQLPDILCKYVEACGAFKLLSGITIAPQSGDYRTLIPADSLLMFDPADALIAAGRPIPPGPWPLDFEWISQWNQRTTRSSRQGMKFSAVNNTLMEGRNEFATMYTVTQANNPTRLRPMATQLMSDAEAQLGATYYYRNWRNRAEWGLNRTVLTNTFYGTEFERDLLLANLATKSFTEP